MIEPDAILEAIGQFRRETGREPIAVVMPKWMREELKRTLASRPNDPPSGDAIFGIPIDVGGLSEARVKTAARLYEENPQVPIFLRIVVKIVDDYPSID